MSFQKAVVILMGIGIGLIGLAAILANVPEGISIPSLPETTGLGRLFSDPFLAFVAIGIAAILASKVEWLRPWIALGGVLAFIYALVYTELPVSLVDFDWGTTPIGERVDEAYGEGASGWLWLAAAVFGLLIYLKVGSTKKISFTSLGDFFASLGLIGLGLFIAVPIGFLIIVFGSILDETFNDGRGGYVMDDIATTLGIYEGRDRPDQPPIDCGQLQGRFGQPGGNPLPEAWTPITICASDARQYVKVIYGTGLEIRFAENQFADALESRGVPQFLTRQVAGAGPSSYNVYVQEATFREIGAEYLHFYMRSAR